MRRGRHRGEQGFSLVELLAVLAIAALIMLITLPAMNNWLRSNRVRTATNLLVTHMRVVRHSAIARSVNASLDYGADGNAYVYDSAKGEQLDHTLPEGVVFSSASPDPLIFEPNGSLSGVASATVQVQGPVREGVAHRYTITVNNVGKISVSKQEVSP